MKMLANRRPRPCRAVDRRSPGGLRVIGWGVLLALGVACTAPDSARQSPPISIMREAPAQEQSAQSRSQAEGFSQRGRPQGLKPSARGPNRWLFVEQIMPNTDGGWATGSFDEGRNKLAIMTRNVKQFAIDTSLIAIDWKRVVILGINGRNSELRRRNITIYHIGHDERGRWIVIEP